eukprot:6183513-Pleurochrysis_carterae.AAC.3
MSFPPYDIGSTKQYISLIAQRASVQFRGRIELAKVDSCFQLAILASNAFCRGFFNNTNDR